MASPDAPAKRARLSKGEGREKAQASGSLPNKKYYRQRAHCNPLGDIAIDVPLTPAHVDWSAHFPAFIAADGSGRVPGTPPMVTIADIGCGFGGMTVALAEMFPRKLVVAMEIRHQVTSFVQQKITGLRSLAEDKGDALAYQNAAAMRVNTMKHMAHYFAKAQLEKMFFLFPDPHFKVANHRRRIISTHLLTEYAYFLKPGGILYTITDVEEVGQWMRSKLEAHPMFEEVSEAELAQDPAAQVLASATEEGKKVARNGGSTWSAVFRRREAPVEA